jgi:shikimate kinase
MNVVLIGMKHCGKSTLGRALAERWGCPFYDVDALIEATHACDRGERLTAREIFTRLGKDYFHQVEGQVVSELYLKLDRPESQAVVALGGRTALNSSITELLGGIGLLVYIHVPPQVLFARVQRTGLPPFLGEADPAGDFLSLCRTREPQYRRLAQLVVELDDLEVPAATDLLARRIEAFR